MYNLSRSETQLSRVVQSWDICSHLRTIKVMWQIYSYWDMLATYMTNLWLLHMLSDNHTDDKSMWQIYAYWDMTNLWLLNMLSGNHTDDKSKWQIHASLDMLTGNYQYDKFMWQIYYYWICWVATTQMINLCEKSMLTGYVDW